MVLACVVHVGVLLSFLLLCTCRFWCFWWSVYSRGVDFGSTCVALLFIVKSMLTQTLRMPGPRAADAAKKLEDCGHVGCIFGKDGLKVKS